ncbi:TetR/AcrR family transcriptional regulator [Nocardioides sp. AE5]|uniref:TetR/AcrR family transcriptional regulator n=1 Tax=Nocardioides sp. AE5 TaxID=2962573 RepID=UPI00288206E6|nr:TetR/AcrR family transcriptional regulator [Nocardioides sp. AE5]MDT0202728.1 TetR/AcrR family transcriptional regulator [Nocardioides sp. AE5]
MGESERGQWFKRTDYDRSDSETRERLLVAAERVLSESGYAKASIARITDAAGVSRATFYVYFESRKEVLVKLAESLVEAAAQAQRETSADPDNPRMVIGEAIDTVLDIYADHGGLVRVIEQQAELDDDIAHLWQQLWSGQIERGAKFIRRLQRAGRSAPGVDPSIAAESMIAVLLHYGLRLGTASEAERDKTAKRLAELYERVVGLPG